MSDQTDIHPVQHVVWLVDNDITQTPAVAPLQKGLRKFMGRLVRNESFPATVSERDVSSLNLSRELQAALTKVEVWTLQYPKQEFGLNCDRGLEVLVYYFDNWLAPTAYLRGETSNASEQFSSYRTWPSIVVSDLYSGEDAAFAADSERAVEKLAGTRFLRLCLEFQIPCIAITSDDNVITKFWPFWQAHPGLHHCTRTAFGAEGDEAMLNLWKRAQRLFWVRELKYELEGVAHKGGQSFCVRVYDGPKLMSEVAHVTPMPYAILYIWAWASVLACVKGWIVSDIGGWEESICPVLSPPPSKLANEIQILVNLHKNFIPTFVSKMNYVFPGDHRHTGYKVCNANIRRLDIPARRTLPGVFCREPIFSKILRELRQILPPEGVAWLVDQRIANATRVTVTGDAL